MLELVKKRRKKRGGWWVMFTGHQGGNRKCEGTTEEVAAPSRTLCEMYILLRSIVIVTMVTFVCFCYIRRDVAAPSPAPIKMQKSKWKFILIEFPHRKLGRHAVRLEKHGTMPRSSTLFFFFLVLHTHLCTQLQMRTVF